jgi:DNA primase
MDAKDEIRARLPIEQLVAQYCQLKKKGRSYVALCPFHNDSHPSMLVSPDKGIAYCFACQSGGDIFSFVQKIENVDFPTAIKILAEKAGVELPKERMSSTPQISKDEKTRLRECLESAMKFYQSRLKAVPVASEYIAKRGVTEELMQQFGIGYAPDSFSETYDHLLKAGFSRKEIVGAGLGVQKDLGEERIYDRFRHRIMFPISDAQGNLVGFGGRTMGDSDAKYVNSPEGILYNKSAVLFGLFHARDAIRKEHRVVLVEGYFDAIAAHKAGIKNVVAVSGTALTEEHVTIIKRYADEVVLCLDQDSAGQLAAGRAFDLLCRANLRIFSVTLPAKDPDELVQKDAASFHRLIMQSALPYIDAVIDRLRTMPDIREPAGKRTVALSLFPLLAAVTGSVELRAYLEKAASAFGIVTSEFSADFRVWQQREFSPVRKDAPVTASTAYSRFELCLGLALIHPAVRVLLPELIAVENPALESVKQALQTVPASQSVEEVLTGIPADAVLKERLKILALYCEENFPAWSEAMALKEFKKLATASNRDRMGEKQKEIVTALKDARLRGRPDEEAMLLTQYHQVLKLQHMAQGG